MGETADKLHQSASTRTPTALDANLASKMALFLGLLAFIAACFTPAVVAWDDERARIAFEETDPEDRPWWRPAPKVEFVPPSEEGKIEDCVALFLIVVSMTGMAAFWVGARAVFAEAAIGRKRRTNAGLGMAAGPAGVVLAAWLSPMGLAFLWILAIAAVFMLLRIAIGFGDIGGC